MAVDMMLPRARAPRQGPPSSRSLVDHTTDNSDTRIARPPHTATKWSVAIVANYERSSSLASARVNQVLQLQQGLWRPDAGGRVDLRIDEEVDDVLASRRRRRGDSGGIGIGFHGGR